MVASVIVMVAPGNGCAMVSGRPALLTTDVAPMTPPLSELDTLKPPVAPMSLKETVRAIGQAGKKRSTPS